MIPDTLPLLLHEALRFVSSTEPALEWILVALAALLIARAPSGLDRRLRPVRAAFRRLASMERAALLVCALLPVAIRLAMLPAAPPPSPSIHDEFSHLLLADTLAHGRLTNPTPPMWRHFESIHIIQRPTYNSMYPPASAAVLAFGEVIFGDPWAGVLLGTALMCAAIWWMMRAWLPPNWALAGALIAGLKVGLSTLWIDTYMGGAVPAIGGALLVGALPRLQRPYSRRLPALALGLGLVILMNSRPFEGALLGAAALVYLVPTLWRRFRKAPAHVIAMVVAPAAVILAGGVLFTGYYCWRVTGSPMRMPYQVNRDTYGWPENLAFLAPRKVQISDPVLENMYLKELHNRDRYHGAAHIFESLCERFYENWTFYLGPLLTLPLLFLGRLARARRTRPLLVLLALIALLNLSQMVLYPYHLGPVVAVIFTLVAAGLRHLYVGVARTGRHRAAALALVLPLCLMAAVELKRNAEELGIPLAYWERAREPHGEARASIERWLTARPRPQLVIVRYAPGHPPDQEWVYNRADIDHAKVVWAREKGSAEDAALLRWFPDREAWIIEADVLPWHVIPYARAPQRSE